MGKKKKAYSFAFAEMGRHSSLLAGELEARMNMWDFFSHGHICLVRRKCKYSTWRAIPTLPH